MEATLSRAKAAPEKTLAFESLKEEISRHFIKLIIKPSGKGGIHMDGGRQLEITDFLATEFKGLKNLCDATDESFTQLNSIQGHLYFGPQSKSECQSLDLKTCQYSYMSKVSELTYPPYLPEVVRFLETEEDIEFLEETSKASMPHTQSTEKVESTV